MTTQQKVISYEYYKALSECVGDYKVDSYKTISIDGVVYEIELGDYSNTVYKSGASSDADVFSQIFNNNDNINIGLLAEEYAKNEGASTGSANGKVSCSEISKAAYKFWKLSNVNIDTIFTGLGFNNSQSNDTVKIWTIGSAPKFDEFIKTNIYEGSKIELDDGLKYYIYSYFLQNESGCGGTLYNTGDNLIISGGGQGGVISAATVKVSMFSSENKLTEYTYITNKTTLNINSSVIPLHYNTAKTCTEIASGLSEVAKKINSERTFDKYFGYIEDAAKDAYDGTIITTDTQSSCSPDIGGLGWIICPATKLLARLADGAFGFISGQFLELKADVFSTSEPTYKSWSIMRNLANILFVIVFMVIVMAQITNLGISNYGVKKMLPRLIIAAILVNLSYFICQIAIDISNILGYSLNDLLGNTISAEVASGEATEIANATNFGDYMEGLLLAGGVVVFIGLSISIPLIISSLFALLMIMFILVARQAVAILLVVIAPIAFVAYLLPNTNKYFDQWKKAFIAVLMVFPIVALVFGGSALAATVLSKTFETVGDNKTIGSIIVGAINVLPLFVVPSLLKKSLDGVGKIGSTINGLGDKWGKGLGSKYENSSFNQFRQKGKARRAAETAAGSYSGKNPFRKGLSQTNRFINDKDSKIGKIKIGKMINTATGGYTGYRSKADQRLKNEEIAKKAEALANEVDPTTGFTKDPREHYDAMRKAYVDVNADKKSTAFQKREAGINLGAANTFLLRTEGRAGVEYVQGQQNRTNATANTTTQTQTQQPESKPQNNSFIHGGVTYEENDSGISLPKFPKK